MYADSIVLFEGWIPCKFQFVGAVVSVVAIVSVVVISLLLGDVSDLLIGNIPIDVLADSLMQSSRSASILFGLVLG